MENQRMKQYLCYKGVFGKYTKCSDGSYGGSIVFDNGKSAFEGASIEELKADYKKGVDDILADEDCKVSGNVPEGIVEITIVR